MASFVVTSDVQQAIRQAEKLQKKYGDDIQGEFKETAAEARRFERLATKVANDIATEQEKYNKKIQDLKDLFARGRIGPEQFKRAVDKLNDSYKVSIEELGQMKSEVDRLNDAYDESGVELGNLADKQDKAFGAGAKAALTGIGIAIGALTEALAKANAELDRIGERKLEDAPTAGALAQLFPGDEKGLARALADAEKTFGEGAFRTEGEAQRLQFELESAGVADERPFFSRLQAIDDAASLAKSAGLVKAAFGESAGSSKELISKAVAAAAPATGVGVSDILEGVANAAESGRKLGLSDEEIFAAVSRVSETTGSGSEAGTRVNSLFRSLIRQGFADEKFGQSLGQTIADVESKGLSEADLITFLGREEAAKALGVLTDRGALGERLGKVETAQEDLLIERSLDAAFAQPGILLPRERRAAAAQKDINLRKQAFRRLRLQAAKDRRRTGSALGNTALDTLEEGFDIPVVTPLTGISAPGLLDVVPDSLEERALGPVNRRDLGARPLPGDEPDMDELARRMEEFHRNQEGAARQRDQQLEEQKKVTQAVDRLVDRLRLTPGMPVTGQ